MSAEPGSLQASLAMPEKPWEDRVEQLFLAVLSRRPTDAERGKFVEHLSVKENGPDRIRDAIWVLMTCSEFRFNH